MNVMYDPKAPAVFFLGGADGCNKPPCWRRYFMEMEGVSFMMGRDRVSRNLFKETPREDQHI